MHKKIFTIEDDANLLAAIQAKFSVVGLECQTNNGNTNLEEVIRSLKSYNPDYVIVDLILPKIDGFEILKKIKEDDDLKNKIVFIFTSLGDQDSREKGERLGADYYLVKTDYSIDGFIEKVIKIIKNKEKNT